MKGGGPYVPPGYIPAPGDDGNGSEILEVTTERQNLNASGQFQAEHWTSGICACFDDLPSCCLGLWCPCVLFGRNVEMLEGRQWVGPCLLHFLLWGVLAFGCCAQQSPFGIIGSCVSCYACGYRKGLRTKYNLEDAPCGDFLTHFFCHTCALCQEYRELREHGHSYPSVSLTDPPPTQSMKDVSAGDEERLPLPNSYQSHSEADN
eukprot:TRINITY_DN23518_c0_g1_i1.p1 TRINITY_DN23518_c0_g1~~TRINITY_DN23518_c0_g1_i1.p1  ORF type:complete len:205 (+),score=9.79 TRINITY_DN23518_c0_g1_i1:217-831(+)